MQQRLGLSAAALKYFAALVMLLDHADLVFHLMSDWSAAGELLFYLPRIIGRMAFPLFAYLLAEGCRRTRNFRKYLLRLGLFALISQIPYSLATGSWGGNTILTFFLAALAVFGFQQISSQEDPSPVWALVPLLAASAAALILRCDYGFPAVLLIFALYLCGENRKRLLLCLGISMALIYLVYQPMLGILSLPVLAPDLILDYLARMMPLALLFTLGAEASLLLLSQYRGQLGVQNKWFFYFFYPLHLLVLWAIKLLIAD